MQNGSFVAENFLPLPSISAVRSAVFWVKINRKLSRGEIRALGHRIAMRRHVAVFP